jgi:hypothetical protein
MIVGYRISGYDNNSYMTGCCDRLFPEAGDVPKCETCGYRTDYRYTNNNFVLKRKTIDFSSTYDGVTIVSLKFKEFCKRYGYKNLVFVKLPKSQNFFQFYIDGNVLEFDANKKDKFCEVCRQYKSVVVPSMKLENVAEPLPDGFYQSDLWFGSGNEKRPITIISPITKANLDIEKFKNICINPIKKVV